MKNRVAALIALTVSVTVLALSACAPVDKDYGVQSSEPVQAHKTASLPKTKSITRSLLYTPAIRLTRFSQTNRALRLRRYFITLQTAR